MSGKVFNDPIHGSIEVSPNCVQIIDTPQFQRLRNIKQLGGKYYVYPGASHNRFEHSIGTCHLAGKLVRSLQAQNSTLPEDQKISDRDVQCVEIAGLCHDLGHGPFSHLFDQMFIPEFLKKNPNHNKKKELEKWTHEKASIAMFDHMMKSNNLELKDSEGKDFEEADFIFIKEMIDREMDASKEWVCKGRPTKKFLYEIISNKRNGIDVDKWDYFARDCHHLGIGNNFNHNRLIIFSRVIDNQICFRDKEAKNIYDMFHTRYMLHDRAYQHSTGSIIDTMITDAMVMANNQLIYIGTDGIKSTLVDTVLDMDAYTKVTDFVLQEILNSSDLDPNFRKAQLLLDRLHNRDLYSVVGYVKLDSDKEKGKIMEDKIKEEAQRNDNLGYFVRKLDFGMKTSNPIDRVKFFRKSDPTTAVDMPKDKVSSLLPNVFMEKSLYFYSKASKGDYKLAKDDLWRQFDDWCRQCNHTAERA